MSRSRRYRRAGGPERRKAFSGGSPPPQPSLWKRAECCGATVAADLSRMGKNWADVHEPDCPAPWDRLGMGGERRPVFPGAPYLPPGIRLRAVNRKAGRVPLNPEHLAAQRRTA